MDEREYLWNMYASHIDFARESETLRDRVTVGVAALVTAIIGIWAVGDVPRIDARMVGVVLIGLALYTALFTWKTFERNRRHVARALEFRKDLEENLTLRRSSDLIRKTSRDRHFNCYRYATRIRLKWLWLGLPAATLLLGVWFLTMTEPPVRPEPTTAPSAAGTQGPAGQ